MDKTEAKLLRDVFVLTGLLGSAKIALACHRANKAMLPLIEVFQRHQIHSDLHAFETDPGEVDNRLADLIRE